MYSPLIGQFAQRDPLGYAAGDENLYRYVDNRPTDATDPSGMEIVSHCNLDKYLKDYISIRNGLADQKGQDGNYWYSNLDGSVSRVGDSLESDILYRMISSSYEYWVAGSNEDTCVAHITNQVDTRIRIVELTEVTKKYRFNTQQVIPKVSVSPEKHPREYFDAINNERTQIACGTARAFVVSAAIGPNGKLSSRKLSINDWVPGDGGYITNTAETADPRWPEMYKGEHIICVGNDQFWGHINSNNTVFTMERWFNIIKSWKYTPFLGSTQYGNPVVEPTVWFPAAGLEEPEKK